MHLAVQVLFVLALACTLYPSGVRAGESGDLVTDAAAPVADEFVFEEPGAGEEGAAAAADGPLSGSLRMITARQIGGGGRWVDLGGSLELKYERFGSFGQVYAEGTAGLNLAFRVEDDPAAVRDEGEIDLRLRELYWSRAFAARSLTAGNLITAWSVGDLMTLSDRLSVTDRSREFFANPEDVISGQNSVKLDLFQEGRRFSAVLVPYPLFDRVDDGNHPYSITPGVPVADPAASRDPEAALRLAFDGDRAAVSLIAGRVNNREPILEAVTDGAGPLSFERIHKPYWFAGLLGTLARDPLLFKAELVVDRRRPRQAARGELPDGYFRSDGAGLLLGLDYNAGDYGTFMLEGVGEWVNDDPRLFGDATAWRAALGWSNALLNDRLTVDVAALALDSPENLILRLKVSYDLTNHLTVTGKLNGIFIGEPSLRYDRIKDHDRADFILEYHF